MDISIKNSSFNENTLIWAVVCSILLHILFFVVVPNFKFDAIKKIPDQLTVEIMQPKPPEPVVIPEPPMPVEPIKPQPEQIKPLPKKELRPEPKPIETTPEPVQAEPPPPPTVITAAPKVDAPPVVTVPPPEPPRKIEPNEDDINVARNQYGGVLGRAIAKHQKYPRLLRDRSIEGELVLEFMLDSDGNVLSASVSDSSGHDAFDKQALEMVKKAAPFPRPPDVLRGRSFNVTVPISFKLENP